MTTGEQPDEPSDAELRAAAAELRTVTSQLLRRLRSAEPGFQVSPTQFAVPSRLSTTGGQTTADLARAERMRPQSMRTTLVPLEELGLIKRVPHPTDGRQSLVSLTPEGEQQVRSNRSIRESWLVHAMTERLSPGERRRLVDSVGLLSRLLD
jgi:DNA-binding MarR family transcriptional regulator